MAAPNNSERISRLQVYAEGIKQRLSGPVPPKHKDTAAGWKQMLEIDLKKTLDTIERLRGL